MNLNRVFAERCVGENDSVIFLGERMMKYENYAIIIYNIYIIYNNEFRTKFCGKGVWGKMTIVICHNCHFLVEKMSGHPCGPPAAHKGTAHKGTGVLHKGDWSPVRFTP